MKQAFENIYRSGEWINSYGGTESGPGSSLNCSSEYLMFLSDFIIKNNIKSILDIGCGDFNLMKHFKFEGLNYLGIDLVDFIVENNNIKYGTSNIKFKCLDILNDHLDTSEYDLILIKDVLQHLNNDTIEKIINRLKFAKNILITNDYTNKNIDCTIGGYRPVNISILPFNFNGNYIFEWNSCGFYKKTFLMSLN